MHRLDLILKLLAFHKHESYIFLHVIFKLIYDTIINRVCNVDDISSSVLILVSVHHDYCQVTYIDILNIGWKSAIIRSCYKTQCSHYYHIHSKIQFNFPTLQFKLHKPSIFSFIVKTSSQTTRDNLIEANRMDRYSDSESESSLPEVLTREQINECNDGDVLN